MTTASKAAPKTHPLNLTRAAARDIGALIASPGVTKDVMALVRLSEFAENELSDVSEFAPFVEPQPVAGSTNEDIAEYFAKVKAYKAASKANDREKLPTKEIREKVRDDLKTIIKEAVAAGRFGGSHYFPGLATELGLVTE